MYLPYAPCTIHPRPALCTLPSAPYPAPCPVHPALYAPHPSNLTCNNIEFSSIGLLLTDEVTLCVYLEAHAVHNFHDLHVIQSAHELTVLDRLDDGLFITET